MTKSARPLALILGLMAAATATPAAADGPQFIAIDGTFLDPFLSQQCGAPVEAHVQGTIIVKARGAATTSTTSVNYSVTFTNLDTGRAVALKTSGPSTQSYGLDPVTGGVRLVATVTGVTRLAVPGLGAVYVDAGRSEHTLILDPETSEVLSVEARRNGRPDELTIEALCLLLSL
jgi:hypothetical protein